MAIIKVVFWVIGIINLMLWTINGMVAMSDDPSGRGMVQMVLIPFTVFVGLVSLVIIGFLT